MTTYRCSEGHTSTDPDYCSVCGAPVDASSAAGPPPPGAPTPSTPAAGAPPAPLPPVSISPPAGAAPVSITGPAQPCPNCGTANDADALFCESCGFDFTTGSLPPAAPPPSLPVPPATVTPAHPTGAYAAPSPPSASSTPSGWVAEVWVDPEWYAVQQEPADPCPTPGAPRVVALPATGALIGRPSARQQLHPDIDCSPDSAVSRRHAQLSLADDRWYLEDLGSTNGTFVAGVADPLPTAPVRQRHELADDERVYVGAWTRIQVRRATDAERGNGA